MVISNFLRETLYGFEILMNYELVLWICELCKRNCDCVRMYMGLYLLNFMLIYMYLCQSCTMSAFVGSFVSFILVGMQMRISKLRSEITFNLDGYWQFLNDKSNRFPTCNNFVSVFGSPELKHVLKAQLSSAFLITFVSSLSVCQLSFPEPLDQFQLNLAQSIIG